MTNVLEFKRADGPRHLMHCGCGCNKFFVNIDGFYCVNCQEWKNWEEVTTFLDQSPDWGPEGASPADTERTK